MGLGLKEEMLPDRINHEGSGQVRLSAVEHSGCQLYTQEMRS